MSLKLKAFIYRFSNIFGLSIYLAKKEEEEHIRKTTISSEFELSIHIGLWQAQNGFTTVWTYKQPFYKAIISKVKHAFDFRSYE